MENDLGYYQGLVRQTMEEMLPANGSLALDNPDDKFIAGGRESNSPQRESLDFVLDTHFEGQSNLALQPLHLGMPAPTLYVQVIEIHIYSITSIGHLSLTCMHLCQTL